MPVQKAPLRYRYLDRWSDPRTWKNEEPPMPGPSIVVTKPPPPPPPNMNAFAGGFEL